MTFSAFTYWFLSSIVATLAGSVAEPSRAVVLFAGLMAMAVAYRHAWLNWKSSSPSL